MNEEWIVADRFHAQRPLTNGSSATAWIGYDAQTGASCIVKCCDLGKFAQEKNLELAEREARVLSSLNHQGIPRYLYSCFEPQELRHIIVYEFADGEDLGTLIAQGKLFTESQALDITIQVVDILMYLSSFSPVVIHRDIKPSNIVISADGKVKLVDFGSVRIQMMCSEEAFGRDNTVVGTFSYMSLEQYCGHATSASDIYSLGITMLHLLTHQHPHELMKSDGNIDISDRVNLSKGFLAILKKMTASEVSKRYSSPTVLMEDLVLLKRGGTPTPLRRKPDWQSIFALVMLLLLAVSIPLLLDKNEPRPPSTTVKSAPVIEPISETIKPSITVPSVMSGKRRPKHPPIEIFTLESKRSRSTNVSGHGNPLKIIFNSEKAGNPEVYIMNSDGSGVTRLTLSDRYGARFSHLHPSGRSIVAVGGWKDTQDLFQLQFSDGAITRLTRTREWEARPRWSSNGKLLFSRFIHGNKRIFVMDNSGQEEILTSWNTTQGEAQFSADGSKVVYLDRKDGNNEVYEANLTTHQIRRVTNSIENEFTPCYSRDGTRLSYVTRSIQENTEIYELDLSSDQTTCVTPFPAVHRLSGYAPDDQQLLIASRVKGRWGLWILSRNLTPPISLNVLSADDPMPSWAVFPEAEMEIQALTIDSGPYRIPLGVLLDLHTLNPLLEYRCGLTMKPALVSARLLRGAGYISGEVFHAPDQPGLVEIELTAKDGNGWGRTMISIEVSGTE